MVLSGFRNLNSADLGKQSKYLTDQGLQMYRSNLMSALIQFCPKIDLFYQSSCCKQLHIFQNNVFMNRALLNFKDIGISLES